MRIFPAEWEKQSFVQFTFPHENSDWDYMLPEVTRCFVELVETAARFQDVLVICDDISRVSNFFGPNNRIFFTPAESNDTWARDHGGITIYSADKIEIQDYVFNGWGLKFAADYDNLITGKLFKNGVFKNCSLKTMDLALEGGSIESDGKGNILTTSACLLSPNRNPWLNKNDLEIKLKGYLGAKQILWLDHGALAGDDTDSHVDTLARFSDTETIVFNACYNTRDEHYDELNRMKDQLATFKQQGGKPYKLLELPLPDPCFDGEGNRLPATYANFTIINNAVLLPLYLVDQDKDAILILKQCFPSREIIGLNCRPLIEQHGSLHCVTMQYPEKVILNKAKLFMKNE